MNNDNNDNSWFKPIGTDAPMPAVGTKSKLKYSTLTSRYFKDANGYATMDRPSKKKRKKKSPKRAPKKPQNETNHDNKPKPYNYIVEAKATAKQAMFDWQAKSDAGLIPECPYF